ncbi:c2h2-like zinc finger protein [Anaeramoeba flamelloides]|uniref:Poly [ADP-ribose] polymerase n=1 Tax=Anaeramoeba flamelloides TaxID=1746091 RepID=A0AAV7ZGX5_9EUKA|nr:c2h2-like zinc finger protein [Anaeramoeba flamelloides]KAJ6227603.1 c2h2-like zinc finger protein [Anaeramoeba flamelloides]
MEKLKEKKNKKYNQLKTLSNSYQELQNQYHDLKMKKIKLKTILQQQIDLQYQEKRHKKLEQQLIQSQTLLTGIESCVTNKNKELGSLQEKEKEFNNELKQEKEKSLLLDEDMKEIKEYKKKYFVCDLCEVLTSRSELFPIGDSQRKGPQCWHEICRECATDEFLKALRSEKLFYCPVCDLTEIQQHQIILLPIQNEDYQQYTKLSLTIWERNNQDKLLYCTSSTCRQLVEFDPDVQSQSCPYCGEHFSVEFNRRLREKYTNLRNNSYSWKDFLVLQDLGINTYQTKKNQGLSTTVIPEKSPQFKEITKMFYKTWVQNNDGMNNNQKNEPILQVKVKAILSVQNNERQKLYEEYSQIIQKKRNGLLNEKLLWHGTKMLCKLDKMLQCGQTNCPVCNIFKGGFLIKKNLSRYQRSFQRYGVGLYFAPNSIKSHAYATESEVEVKGMKHRVLLLCRVACGKEKRYTKSNQGMKGPARGHDSTHGLTGRYLKFDEIIVYDERAALPVYAVVYTYSIQKIKD